MRSSCDYTSVAIAFIAVIANVNGYNLDFREESIKLMKSPVLQELEKTASGSSTPELNPPSFYGYQMNLILQRPSDPPRLMVGSPKMTDPLNPAGQKPPSKPVKYQEQKFKPKGAVHSCPVQTSFFNSNGRAPSPTCSAANPTPTNPGDGFGTSLATHPNGDMSACSPGRAMNCTADSYSPGFCYASENYGGQWSMDEKSKANECPESTVDVMFVLDGSGSVAGHFGKVKKWVKSITKKLEPQMRTGYIQVGVVQYSHFFDDGRPWSRQRYIKTEIELGSFRSYRLFERALDRIRLQNYTTFTGRALEKVAFDFENSTRFSRTKNKQMMFLLTDGKSKDSNLVKPNADALRAMGVETYAVGVKNADKKELGLIATGRENSRRRVYSVEEFDQLDSLVETFQTKILDFVLEGGGSTTTTNYKMEQAQTGFSSAFEKRVVRSSCNFVKQLLTSAEQCVRNLCLRVCQ